MENANYSPGTLVKNYKRKYIFLKIMYFFEVMYFIFDAPFHMSLMSHSYLSHQMSYV